MADIDELQSRIGESKRSVVDFRIEAGKVAEFAWAIGENNPAFYDEAAAREQGYEAVPAPPTFTRVAMFPRYRPPDGSRLGIDVGFDFRREIHGEQAYEFERPVYVGDVLQGTTTLTDTFQREGSRGGTMTIATLETEYRDVDGEPIVTERSTIIETESAIEGGADERDEAAVPPRIDGATVSQTATGYDEPIYVEDVAVGDEAFELTVDDLTRTDFVRYAGASGDFNPIHYDEPYARSLGNPCVFGQGMLTAGYASHFVADWFGLDAIRRFECRFVDRVWPGDTLTVTGTVNDVDKESRRVAADVAVDRQTGGDILDIEVTADLRSRSES